MVKYILHSFTILQKEFRRKKKQASILNKEFNSILIIINGISEKINNEYLVDTIKFDELYTNMDRLSKIESIFEKIKTPITVHTLMKIPVSKLINQLQNIKYLLHELIKITGAKTCAHTMQIFLSRDWYKKLSKPYINLFKLFNRIFIPVSATITTKNDTDIVLDQTNLPYVRKIDVDENNFIMKLNGAELVCPLINKNVIIKGYFITDPLTNIPKEIQMKSKFKKLHNRIRNLGRHYKFSELYLNQLSLRDFIVLNIDQLIQQISKDYSYLQDLKKESLPGMIKRFLQGTLAEQHKIITIFLLDNNDSKFMAHIIFDMLYTDSALSSGSPYGSILYKNLHWSVQRIFKKNYSSMELYKKKLTSLDSEKIPYETRIIGLKASDNVKEKAFEKLKEINSSRDGSMTSKATKYLDGILKIPFGVYREEVIISFLDKYKTKLSDFIKSTNIDKDAIIHTESDINNFFNKINTTGQFNDIYNEWQKYNTQKVEYIQFVRKTLDDCVYGHNNIKLQLEQILGQWINGKSNGVILGLVGPPGIGKTCIIKHGLSKCLVDKDNNPRPFAFLPLGGATNGSFLDGHSYTYVGSTWGRIVDILIETKCMNPIIFIDELDKVSNTEHGREIVGILTHLTDASQNTEFTDKYFAGIKFDLSKCLIVFTYNDASKVDRILRDRITTVEMKALTKKDKLVIADKYLLPEIYDIVGYNKSDIIFENEAISFIIDSYTYEAGVRKLKEKLFEVIRQINLSRMFDLEIKLPFTVTQQYIEKLFSDKSKILVKKISEKSACGVVNGLYATAAGVGGLTIIQAFKTISDSKELKLEYTGSQGDVMKESIKCAKTIAWNIIPNKIKDKIKSDWENNGSYGLHIHCPDTSTPKDGPSAGGAITLAIISQLCDIPVKNTVAMTGEIDLKGNITAIGGVHSKLEGAISAGATLALLPEENRQDYEKIKDKLLIEGTEDQYRIKVIFISSIYNILENALEDHDLNFKLTI